MATTTATTNRAVQISIKVRLHIVAIQIQGQQDSSPTSLSFGGFPQAAVFLFLCSKYGESTTVSVNSSGLVHRRLRC